ncbi:MAG: NAD(P)-dependent oxidoreductase [Pseudomonadota bacterium]|nr:NAD(P)-dependent oxidoreductase [Pseudomonadota bacterium]
MGRRKKKIGFIGLGNMGRPMASHLASSGLELIVYDITTELASRVASDIGATAAVDLEEVAKFSNIIVTSLPNGKIVEDVMIGTGGLANLMNEGSILIDMSSSDPIKTGQLGAKLKELGIGMIDAPVSGGVKGALDGTLTIIVGGEAKYVKRADPLLNALSQKVFHVGHLGCGQAMKALNNLCSATGLLIVAEVLRAGQAFGLQPETMIDVLNVSTGRNNSTENKIKQFILSGAYKDAGFAMDLMVKDISTAIAFANELNINMLLGKASVGAWSDALSSLEGSPDHTEIVRWVNGEAS